MHLGPVVAVCRPLDHHHLLRIREEVAAAVAVEDRLAYPEKGVAEVVAEAEAHRHSCSLEEVGVGEAARAA